MAGVKRDGWRRTLSGVFWDLDLALITDEPSLWDFHGSDDNRVLIAKISRVYGVDVSDIEFAKALPDFGSYCCFTVAFLTINFHITNRVPIS